MEPLDLQGLQVRSGAFRPTGTPGGPDFLADHAGRKVYVEIGTRDCESVEQPADAFILQLYGHRLGKVEDATDHNPDGDRKAPMFYLEPIDVDPPDEDEVRSGSRLFINPRQVSKVQGDPPRSLKVWLDDEAVYIGIIPSGPRPA